MISFSVPTEDILFSLREVAGARDVPGWDGELSRDILSAFAGFAEGAIAPLNEIGDVQGCRLANGRVSMPDGFSEAFTQLIENG